MPAPTSTCPRCLTVVPDGPGTRYCRRCGLGVDVARLAAPAPADIAVAGRSYRVLDRVGVGSRCVVYRCHFHDGRATVEGTFKVARDALSNSAVAREAEALRHLHAADPAGRFTPFVPAVVESFGYVSGPGEPPRHANVLRLHPEVRSPANDLYTLADVRAAYPAGLDARDMAWVWRRLLTALGFAHSEGIAHGAVFPGHVLIGPADHKLVLIGWCDATLPGRPPVSVPPAAEAAYRQWVAVDRYPSPAADLRLAARCMVDLVGDQDLPPAIARHLSRAGHGPTAYALRLRADFDRLIADLWGPRQFRPLTMPTKS